MLAVLSAAIEVYALQLLAALVAAGPRWRRALALIVALPNLLLAWQIPAEHTFWRASIALLGTFGYLRLFDLVLARTEISPAERVWRALAFLDTTRLRYGPPALDTAALRRTLGYGVLTIASAWICFVLAPPLAAPVRQLARWGGGAVFAYSLIDAGYAAIAFVLRALGIIVYALHRAPILSRSVQELWGERWARTVSLLLFTRTFKPLARRGMPRLGLMASFAASGLFHAIGALAALGWTAAGIWTAYFLLQGMLVIAERALGVDRWPSGLAHVWVVAVMLATSPLFVAPLLQILAGS